MSRSQVCFLLLCSLLMACMSWAQTPMTFLPTGPCRVLDTRGDTGPFGGPSLQANTVRTLNIPANPACFVPDFATAYALNVTVVPHGPMGYITLWPDGQTQPVVSTINSYNGEIKAVAAIVAAGDNSSIDMFTTDTTDLVLDIMGYFVAPGNRNALYYYPLPSICELVNTVDPPTPNGLGGPALLNGQPRTFQVTNNPNCKIPTAATAYVLNVIAMPVGGAPLDYLTVWPSDQAQPLSSNLNSSTGVTIANAVIVNAQTGAISMYASGNDANVEVDLTGYFGPASWHDYTGNYDHSGDALYTFSPCRGDDTRPYEFVNRMDYNLLTQGGCVGTLPPGAATPPVDAYVLNVTAIPDGPMGYLAIWPYGSQAPVPPTFMSEDGSVMSNMVVVPAGRRSEISAFSDTPINLIYDVFGYFASPQLTILTQMPIPAATEHVPYGPITIQARGGVPPYTWTANLPEDLSIDPAAGVISGCPLLPGGDPQMSVRVTDSKNHTAPPMSGNLTINSLPALAITTTSLPGGTLSTPYSETLTAIGGYGTYTWNQVGGNLPPGFTLSSNGVISGYDGGTRGRWRFTVQVVDQECEAPTPPTQQLSITIN